MDTWNPSGTSLVWVKVPELSQGTKILAYYGNGVNPGVTPSAAWSGYAGVWHLGEASGTAYDATANSLNGTPTGTKAASMVAYTNGAVGKARVNFDNKSYLSIPNYNSLGLGGTFTISGWFLANAVSGYPRLFSRKQGYADSNGWEIEMNSSSKTQASARGASGTSVTVNMPDITTKWLHLALVYNGTTLSCYTNGALSASGTIAVATDNGYPLSFGCDSNGDEAAFNGQYDEIRLVDAVATPAWLATEYTMAANSSALSYGEATTLDVTAPVFAMPTVVKNANGTFTVSVSLTGGEGDLYARYNDSITNALSNGYVQAPQSYTDTPANLATNTCYTFAAFGTNANGTATTKFGASTFLTGEVSVQKTADADEYGLVPGSFTFSRPANDEARLHYLAVTYTVSGTAVAGQNYVNNLSGTLVIPAGQASATVVVTPIIDATVTEDTTVVLTVSDGLHYLGTASATVTIKNLVAPEGYNTWVATTAGKASVGQNWSAGRVPNATDNILLDGRFSTAAMEWDGGVNSLSATVASWTQATNYPGTVTFDTTYPAAATVFTNFTVTGNAQILAGTWTHQPNAAVQSNRLCLAVGGDFTLATGTKLDAYGKGFAAGKFPVGSTYGAHAASYDGYAKVYGDVYRPADLGAGAKDTRAGGGAIWLEVGGAATINGTVDVRAPSADAQMGASGSFFLQAASCSGTGNIYAYQDNQYSGARGSGGRVAIALTSAATLAFPTANIKVSGSCNGSAAGGGTIVVKTAGQTNGTLILDNTRGKSYGARWQYASGITAIPSGASWTFDDILVKNHGMLAIPPTTTLTLAGGLPSVRAASVRTGGLLYAGGTINWGGAAPYVFTSNWVFQANAPYTFDGNVVVKDGGAIGCMKFRGTLTNFAICDVAVQGNLTVEQTGSIFAQNGGPDIDINREAKSFHGGQSGGYGTVNMGYGSVFAPARPGYTAAIGDQATTSPGGGAVKLAVSGTLTVDGSVLATSVKDAGDNSMGSGGSIAIVAGTLAGSGKISASCGSWSVGSIYGTGGGGRIAIRLTGADIGSNGIWTNIVATGSTVISNTTLAANVDYSSSGGTVYLQGKNAAEGAGRIVVRNDGNPKNNKAVTAIPAALYGDAPEAFKRATLSIEACGRVLAAADLRMEALEIEAGSVIDLRGRHIVVRECHLNKHSIGMGTFTANSPEVQSYVIDSAGGGSVQILGAGTVIVIR